MEMTPIQPKRAVAPLGRAGRLVLAATVGRDTLDARLAALAPLRTLGLGSVALFDDGTLTGADRVRLARQCSDPLILPVKDRVGTFPAGPEWALLLAALDQRRNAYWVTIGGTTPEGTVPDLARAVASNRSFAIVDDDPAPDAIKPHLDGLARDGFPYICTSPRLLGFAACADGLALATAVLARLQALLGDRARQPEMAHIVAGFILAREREPVLMRDTPKRFIHRAGFE
jgi:hypothetical protein